MEEVKQEISPNIFRAMKDVKEVSSEDIINWINHPITKTLIETVKEFNSQFENEGKSLYIGVQYSKEDKDAILHFFCKVGE